MGSGSSGVLGQRRMDDCQVVEPAWEGLPPVLGSLGLGSREIGPGRVRSTTRPPRQETETAAGRGESGSLGRFSQLVTLLLKVAQPQAEELV